MIMLFYKWVARELGPILTGSVTLRQYHPLSLLHTVVILHPQTTTRGIHVDKELGVRGRFSCSRSAEQMSRKHIWGCWQQSDSQPQNPALIPLLHLRFKLLHFQISDLFCIFLWCGQSGRATEERLRKTKLIILSHPRDQRHPQGWSGSRRHECGHTLCLSLYWGFCGKSKPGQVNGLELVNLNSFSRHRTIGVVFQLLSTWPWDDEPDRGCLAQDWVWLVCISKACPHWAKG